MGRSDACDALGVSSGAFRSSTSSGTTRPHAPGLARFAAGAPEPPETVGGEAWPPRHEDFQLTPTDSCSDHHRTGRRIIAIDHFGPSPSPRTVF